MDIGEARLPLSTLSEFPKPPLTDAKQMLLALEAWLRTKNESVADSLVEAFENLLTLHRPKVPARLRKMLMSTNPIEIMSSMVRHSKRHIKPSGGSAMLQR